MKTLLTQLNLAILSATLFLSLTSNAQVPGFDDGNLPEDVRLTLRELQGQDNQLQALKDQVGSQVDTLRLSLRRTADRLRTQRQTPQESFYPGMAQTNEMMESTCRASSLSSEKRLKEAYNKAVANATGDCNLRANECAVVPSQTILAFSHSQTIGNLNFGPCTVSVVVRGIGKK